MNPMPKHPIKLSVVAMLAFATFTSIAAAPEADHAPSGPTPDQAYQFLREGNHRFAIGQSDYPNTGPERRERVAAAQNPFAAVLSCADSRVPVELLFDRGIGDVFVVRVAGNVADGDEIGSIEYAAGHLNVPLAVVLGHSSCGAVKAVASGAEVHGSLPGLVDNIIPAVEWVKKNRPELQGEELVNAAIEANVWQSIDDLITNSEEVRTRLENRKLKVVGAVYDLVSGKVRWLGEHPYQDSIVTSARSEHAKQTSAAATASPTAAHPVPNEEAPPMQDAATVEAETMEAEHDPQH